MTRLDKQHLSCLPSDEAHGLQEGAEVLAEEPNASQQHIWAATAWPAAPGAQDVQGETGGRGSRVCSAWRREGWRGSHCNPQLPTGGLQGDRGSQSLLTDAQGKGKRQQPQITTGKIPAGYKGKTFHNGSGVALGQVPRELVASLLQEILKTLLDITLSHLKLNLLQVGGWTGHLQRCLTTLIIIILQFCDFMEHLIADVSGRNWKPVLCS